MGSGEGIGRGDEGVCWTFTYSWRRGQGAEMGFRIEEHVGLTAAAIEAACAELILLVSDTWPEVRGRLLVFSSNSVKWHAMAAVDQLRALSSFSSHCALSHPVLQLIHILRQPSSLQPLWLRSSFILLSSFFLSLLESRSLRTFGLAMARGRIDR